MQADTYIRQIESFGRIDELSRRIGKLGVPLGRLLESIEDNHGLIAQLGDTIPVKFAEELTKPLSRVMSSTSQLLCELERNTWDAAITVNYLSLELANCYWLPHAGPAWTESRIQELRAAVANLEFLIADLTQDFARNERGLGKISSHIRALFDLRASLTQRVSS